MRWLLIVLGNKYQRSRVAAPHTATPEVESTAHRFPPETIEPLN